MVANPAVIGETSAARGGGCYCPEIMTLTADKQQAVPGKSVPPLAPDRAFFLDVDGTLLDLADKPDQVVVRPGLTDILQTLLRVSGGAVALISGRSIADLDRLFAPLQLPAAGQHGLERRDQHGRMHYHHQLDGRLDAARERLRRFAEDNPGILLEDKQFSLAVHYRQAPDKVDRVTTVLEEIMPDIADEFQLQKGKMVFEIRPGGRDKGMAIAEFMQEAPFHGRKPIFIGDDVTDEDGFVIVNNMEGYSIKVGEGDTAANWHLPDTGAVLDMLNDCISYQQSRQQDQQ